MNTKLSVLIVHYYAEGWLPGLVASMQSFLPGVRAEILIWDNGSQHGKPSKLDSACSLIWLRSPLNIGFANGHNALARQASGQRFLIVNPDSQFVVGSLERLWKTAEENLQAGVVAPRIRYPDGRLQVSVFPPYNFSFDLRKSFWLEQKSFFSTAQKRVEGKLVAAQEPFPVGWATGACMLVSREAWEKTGGFDSNFFFGGEDADFCRRVQEAGFEVLCEPRALVIHQTGQSLKMVPKDKVLYYYQKRLYYAHKHFSRAQYAVLWLTSLTELMVKWTIGFFLSFFSCRWREKRRGYAEALSLAFFGRWRSVESLMQKRSSDLRKPVEAAV